MSTMRTSRSARPVVAATWAAAVEDSKPEVASEVATAVEQEMQSLGMPGGRFSIELSTAGNAELHERPAQRQHERQHDQAPVEVAVGGVFGRVGSIDSVSSSVSRATRVTLRSRSSISPLASKVSLRFRLPWATAVTTSTTKEPLKRLPIITP